jgi:PAS domain S-box-containing protein
MPADATRHATAQTQLRASAERFRLVVESVRDYAIFMLDPTGRVATWNLGAERIKGYRAADIIGRHFSEFYPPEALAAGKPAWELEVAEREGRVEDEGWRVREDGSRFWASVVITALRDEAGRLVGFAKVTRDLTERKRAEDDVRRLNAELERRVAERTRQLAALNRELEAANAALRANQARLETLTRLAPVGLFRTDAVGDCTYVNERWCELTGLGPEQASGQGWVAALHPGDRARVAAEWYDAARQGREFRSEYRFRRPDGTTCWVAGRAMPELGADGEVTGYIGAVADVTDRKRAEAEREALLAREQAARAEAEAGLRARDEFLSIASHELKTPLTPLQLQVQLLVHSLRTGGLASVPPERLGAMLESAERQSKRFAALIEDLLDVSRVAAGRLELEPEAVDLAEVARGVAARFELELTRSGSSLTLALDGPVVGHWDRLRLEQVVTNLLSNAVKYGAGGPIEVRVEGEGGLARLVVRDRGIGIAAEDQGRIFGRFERAASSRHYGGLGMGLYITRQIVEAHGGSVRVASAPGAGSTFTVELPRRGAAAPAAPES